jgi:hypothetical protein
MSKALRALAQGSSNSECLNGYTENAITMGIAMAMTCLKRMGFSRTVPFNHQQEARIRGLYNEMYFIELLESSQ